jgi:hypothetical protein
MKVFKRGKEEKKEKPQIEFVGKEMTAVDECGMYICTIVDFGSCKFIGKTRECLERDGYSTDWAKWDEDGRMIKLLEDFE